MKTKIFLSILALFACAATLSAQKITREQADEIVINYLKSEGVPLNFLYVNANTPSENGFTVTTSKGETVKAKYACWVYSRNRIVYLPCDYPDCPQVAPPLPSMIGYRYIFVKEDNGSLLEIITSDDTNRDLNLWTEVKVPQGIVEPKANNKFLYPNPVGDWLTIPCNGENTRVEIYDLKGTRLLTETLSGQDTWQLNVSFLSAGVYMVNVGGRMYKIVKF